MKANKINKMINKTFGKILILILITFFSLSCQKWSYKKQYQWNKNYSTCSTPFQSPIDIKTDNVKKDSLLSPLFIDYSNCDTFTIKRKRNLLYISNLKGTITAPDTALWGHEYYLSQIIIHTPSEHSVNGKKYPAELQFINIDTSGQLLAIAVFVDYGQENSDFSLILNNFPNKESQIGVDKQLNIGLLLPLSAQYWHYIGTLTFPPCHNNIQWYVIKSPIHASKAQIDSLSYILGKNTRNIQPLNGRKITEF